MWMGWKPLSLTAYLLELERGIETKPTITSRKENLHSFSFHRDLPLSYVRQLHMC